MSISLRVKVWSVIAYVAAATMIVAGWHPEVTLSAGAFG